jgi:hypothetical protein
MENFFNKLLGKKTEAIKNTNPEEFAEHVNSAAAAKSENRLKQTEDQLQKELLEIQSEHDQSKLIVNQSGELEEKE